MNFRVDRWSAAALRSSLVILTMVGALLLSSCGGGGQSSQSERFKPTRMIVFGDESSLLVPTTPGGNDSRKFTNNGFNFVNTTVIDCANASRLWVQYLADEYGLVFAECNPNGATATAQMRAKGNAKVEGTNGLVQQVDEFLASTPGNAAVPTDLITMMAGTNDVIELYDRVTNSANPAPLSQAAAVAEAKRRAVVFAAQIDRLTNRSNTLGRVMYSTVPELGLTPFGLSKPLADQTLLNLLTTSFNDEMRLNVYDNGRSRGFLNTSQQFRNVIDFVRRGKSVSRTDITNVTVAVCQDPVNLLSCTNNTLVTGATATSHLWAGNVNFSAAGHILVGNDAVDLVTSLPW